MKFTGRWSFLYLFVSVAALVVSVRASRRLIEINPVEQVGRIVVEALIQSDAVLHIGHRSIYWESVGPDRPGSVGQLNEPTFVNGLPWTPKWKTDPVTGISTSDRYGIDLGTSYASENLLAVGEKFGGTSLELGKPVVFHKVKREIIANIPNQSRGARWYRFSVQRNILRLMPTPWLRSLLFVGSAGLSAWGILMFLKTSPLLKDRQKRAWCWALGRA